VVLLVCVGALIAAALGKDGYQTPELDLHDAGVWISDAGRGAIGRTNTQIHQVDVRMAVGADQQALLQADEVVLVHLNGPTDSDLLLAVDGKTALPKAKYTIPDGAIVDLQGPSGQGSTVVVLDPHNGQVWTAPGSDLAALGFADAEEGTDTPQDGAEANPQADAPGSLPSPKATVKGGSIAAVGLDGLVRVYSASRQQITVLDATGATTDTLAVKGETQSDQLQMAVVGTTPVVLDQEQHLLLRPGAAPVSVGKGGTPQLQLTGPAHDTALVADDHGVVPIPLRGSGEPQPALFDGGTGKAARPLVLGGCAYTAWSGTPTFAELCDGGTPRDGALPGFVEGKSLQFRTNRGKVLINELDTGQAFVIADGVAGEVDWTHAESLDPNKDEDDDAPPQEADLASVADQQEPPVANDDDGSGPGYEAFATRPDRAVVIDPLRNDKDPNDDVLVIETVKDVQHGTAEIVGGGRSVQVTPAPGSRDSVRFTYSINDGFDGHDTAVAVVEIHDPSTNGAPVLRKKPTTTVVAGRVVTHNVLAEAYDPDGDAMSLEVASVSVPTDPTIGPVGAVTASPDGTITYTAPGEVGAGGKMFEGPVTIPFTITDNLGTPTSETRSELVVTVLPAPGQAPVARPDHAQTSVGRQVVVDVLANDSDADGDLLRVVSVDPSPLASFDIDAKQRVHVTASAEGTIVVRYTVTDGPNLASAKLRIDVAPAASTSNPPVAVRDDALLRPGVPAIVDALANDSDPDGDILVVERAVVPPSVNLAVEVVDHHLLRISTADGGLLQGVSQFTYVITDGSHEAMAQVVVRPAPSATEEQPPTAVDDEVEVRAGNVGAFDVLANDTDPEGGGLRLELGEVPAAIQDAVFVQGDLLRFIAPATAGEFKITYSAVDPTDRKDTATVTVRVREKTILGNPPRPPDLEARTVAGRPVKITVPLATMDPDGDAVTLLGISEDPPKHGAVTAVDGDSLTYRPDRIGDGYVGSDSFTYRVRDASGMEASGTVRVGVAPLVALNSPPVAIDDLRQVPANGSLAVQVLSNDSDPDGDELSVLAGSVRTPPGVSWSAEQDGNTIKFSPKGLKAGQEAAFGYTVTDGILTDDGLVRVTVVDQADNEPPVARDDNAPDAVSGRQVRFDVLANDFDPDGEHEDLKVVRTTGLDGVSVSGGELSFTMPRQDVAIIYSITDAGQATGRAVLRVRAADLQRDLRLRPTANYDEAKTSVGKAVDVDVLGNDEVEPGRRPELFQVSGDRGGRCELAGQQVRFTPHSDFVGFGGCTYTMGDGAGDATDTLRAVGSVGVVVEGGKRPPRFIEQPLRVRANEEVTVDLTNAVRDADGNLVKGSIDFGSVEGATSGVSGRFKGHELTVKATPDVLEGDVVSLHFKVATGDGETEGKVTVTVTKYVGALAQLTPDTAETVQLVDLPPLKVLENDRRAIDDQPLKIVSVTHPVGGSVSNDESTISFTAAPEFHGSTSFTYTVDDGTKQADRQVTTTVTINVVGFPDAPAAPSVQRESQAITLSWGAPADNGAPITEYWIRATGGAGARTEKTSATTFRFDGLKNGDSYRFEIGAVNRAVSEAMDKGKLSEPRFGPASPEMVPNAVPNTPAAPTAKFDPKGGAIDLTWADPGGDGTKVERYEITASPPPPGGNPLKADAPQTEMHVTGLNNGTPYTFSVVAINRIQGELEGRSQPSASSVAETPAAPPSQPSQPKISQQNDQNIVITWTAPNANGDAIKSYDVEVFRDGASQGVKHIADPGTPTTTITTDNGPKFTFTVRATNKAGDSPYSLPSAEATSYGVPGQVPGSVTATEGDGTSTLSFGDAPPNGNSVKRYEYLTPGGSWTTLAANKTVTGLTNGTSYTFQVRGCNDRGCATATSATSNSVRPYGSPTSPTNVQGSLSGSNGNFTITWTWGASSPNGHNNVTYYLAVSPPANNQVVASSGAQTNLGWGQCRTAQVQARGDRTSDGQRVNSSWVSSAEVCTPQQPANPTVQARLNGTTSAAPCDDPAHCKFMEMLLQGFPPNSSHSIACQVVNGAGNWQTVASGSVTVDGNGNWGWGRPTPSCYVQAHQARILVDGSRASNIVNSYA
jgi:hypothetical protein